MPNAFFSPGGGVAKLHLVGALLVWWGPCWWWWGVGDRGGRGGASLPCPKSGPELVKAAECAQSI